MKNQTTIYDNIVTIIKQVPVGHVATYGQIAEMAGHKRGARLVGHALRKSKEGESLPWHRIINAQGKSSFPEGSRFQQEQYGRLQAEGIVIIKNRINLAKYGWQPSLDELLWKNPLPNQP